MDMHFFSFPVFTSVFGKELRLRKVNVATSCKGHAKSKYGDNTSLGWAQRSEAEIILEKCLTAEKFGNCVLLFEDKFVFVS